MLKRYKVKFCNLLNVIELLLNFQIGNKMADPSLTDVNSSEPCEALSHLVKCQDSQWVILYQFIERQLRLETMLLSLVGRKHPTTRAPCKSTCSDLRVEYCRDVLDSKEIFRDPQPF